MRPIILGAFLTAFLLSFSVAEDQTPSQESSSVRPDVTLTLKDTRVEGSHGFKFWDAVRIGLRAGVASARQSLLGGPAIPYATLNPSSYATATLEAGHKGKYFQIRGLGTYGIMQMRSQRTLLQPNEPSKFFDQFVQGGSFFGNVVGVLPLAKRAALAFFGGPEAWVFNAAETSNTALSDSQAYGGLNAGMALALKISDSQKARLWFQGSAFAGHTDSFQNWKASGKPNWGLFARALEGGGQYSVKIGRSRLNLGFEETHDLNLFTAITPKASFEIKNFKISAQRPMVFSKNPWVADSQGVAGGLNVKLARNVDIDLQGVFENRNYGDWNGPISHYSAIATLNWTPYRNAQYRPAKLEAQRTLARGRGGYPRYSPLGTIRLRLDEEAQERFKKILRQSPTFEDFATRFAYDNVSKEEDIIAAAAIMSGAMYKFNYNDYDETERPNANSTEKVYERWRQSYLSEQEYPMLRCIGVAQVTSEFVNALAKETGIQILAAPVTVYVAEGSDGNFENTSYATHAAPMIKTSKYGIVFVEGDRVIPTNTPDTEEALQIFQARQGVPGTIHYLGDPNRKGRTIGVIRGAESGAVLEALTYEGEEGFERIPTQASVYDPGSGRAARREAFEALDRVLSR